MKITIYSIITSMLLMVGVTSAETLQLEGSTTVGPIADAFAEYFKSIYPDLQITGGWEPIAFDGAGNLLDF